MPRSGIWLTGMSLPWAQTLLAVRLLDQVTAAQARRVTTTSRRPDLGMLSMIIESDVPEHLFAVIFSR